MIVTIIDSLTKRVRQFATCEADLSAEKFTRLFIDNYICSHGIPTVIDSDRDV